MIEKLRKIICYTLIFTLFNTSFQPTYAFPDFDDDVKGDSTHSRKMITPPLESPQTDEQASVSLFFKALWGVTKSVMRRSLKPLALLAIVAHHTRGVDAGDEFRVNQNGTGDQLGITIANAINGSMSMFMVWEGSQTGNSDIYGRLFVNGTPFSNDILINQVSTCCQYAPSVASLPNRNLFIAWFGLRTPNYGIYGRLLSPDAPLTNEFPINQNTTNSQFYPCVTSLNDENVSVFVSWTSSQVREYDVHGRFFSSSTPLSDDILINQNTRANYYPAPSTVSLNNKTVLVIWGTLDYNIWGRRLFLKETTPSNEFLINKNTTSVQLHPSALGLPDRNAFFVAWSSNHMGKYDIYGRFFDENETALSDDDIPINPNGVNDNYWPCATLTNKNLLLAWREGYPNGNITGRLLSPSGTIRSDVFLISQNITSSKPISCVSLPDGSVVISWPNNPTGNWDIYSRILDNATLSSYLYPAPAPLPSPLPVPSPRPAPAPVLTPAPLPVPASELAPAPVPSPIFTPSLFTQPSSETNPLSPSELSTYMLTPSSSSLPFSSSTVLWDSSSSLLEPSTTSPSGRTAAIIGGAAGGAAFLIIAVVVAILVKVFCCSGEDKKEAPDSSPVDEEDVEDKEESSDIPPTGPDRMTLTNVTDKVTKNLTDTQRMKDYVDLSGFNRTGSSKVVDEDDDRGYQYIELSSIRE